MNAILRKAGYTERHISYSTRLRFPPQVHFLRHCSLHLSLLLVLTLLLAACGSSNANKTSGSVSPTAVTSSREPLLAPPLAGSYAALGASETYGVGAVPHTAGYAYLVARALHARHFVDAGIPGATVSSGYQSELTAALNTRPSLCTVFFGVNDVRAGVTRADFLQNLHDLVATLRQAHAQVLIVGFPDLSQLPAVVQAHIAGVSQITASWNAGIRRVARQTGAHVVDLSRFGAEIARHPNYIATDGLHPSTAGHRRIAQVVIAAIRQAGLWKAP